jgi:predicted DNA binding CopG/RHH family protein
MKKLKKLPVFKNEDEQRKFWATHSSVDYIDWSKAKWTVFPNLKRSDQLISMRVPQYLLADIKVLANKMDVPYQSMIKMWLSERVKRENTAALL